MDYWATATSEVETMTSRPATQVQLETVLEEVLSPQVKQEAEEPVVPTRVPLADTFQDQVTIQKMRLQNL